MPSLSVFCVISKHFTATLHIPRTSQIFKTTSIKGNFSVKLKPFTPDLITRLQTLEDNRGSLVAQVEYFVLNNICINRVETTKRLIKNKQFRFV